MPVGILRSLGESYLEFSESEPRPRLSASSGTASTSRVHGGRRPQRVSAMLSLRNSVGESGLVAGQQTRGQWNEARASLGGTVLQCRRIQDKCASGKRQAESYNCYCSTSFITGNFDRLLPLHVVDP